MEGAAEKTHNGGGRADVHRSSACSSSRLRGCRGCSSRLRLRLPLLCNVRPVFLCSDVTLTLGILDTDWFVKERVPLKLGHGIGGGLHRVEANPCLPTHLFSPSCYDFHYAAVLSPKSNFVRGRERHKQHYKRRPRASTSIFQVSPSPWKRQCRGLSSAHFS